MDILDYLEMQMIYEDERIPKKIEIITRNLAEKKKMEVLADKLTNPNYVASFRKRFSE